MLRKTQLLTNHATHLYKCNGVTDLSLPLEIRSSPTCVILPNLVVLGQTVPALLSRSAWEKIDPRIQPFNVTQGHLNGQESIRHPGLPINVPQQPWTYLVPFPRKTAVSVENCKFPHHRLAPAEGELNWNCVPALGVKKKLEWWGYWAEKEIWRYLQPSGYNTRTWQTDRETDTGWQQRPRLRIASRGNKTITTYISANSTVWCVIPRKVNVTCQFNGSPKVTTLAHTPTDRSYQIFSLSVLTAIFQVNLG